jgi:ubiquinone/menaquinone biosynthesis C-methylase UbiE
MDTEQELAYRYDLFIVPEWRERFDSLVGENITPPEEGRFLDVNCGTGAHAIQMAERLKDKGEVVALDTSRARLNLAEAKAQALKVEGVTFKYGDPAALPFSPGEFDAVIGDASMLRSSEIEPMLEEMARVSRPGAPVTIKLATHGSFDEFFSVYWEALYKRGVAEQVWSSLEALINERRTISDAEEMATRAGLHSVNSFTSKEEFLYGGAIEFLDSPLIADVFLSDWLGILDESQRPAVRDQLIEVIEEERAGSPFDVSIKATVLTGVK